MVLPADLRFLGVPRLPRCPPCERRCVEQGPVRGGRPPGAGGQVLIERQRRQPLGSGPRERLAPKANVREQGLPSGEHREGK